MRLDLFSKGDSVLLLGEGNFSFSVCLHKHKLPIEIVATCFEGEAEFGDRMENISYLKSNKVPVFFNVDATKLHEHAHLSNSKFSKVVFNFPHINGKMKIHLNRQLLKESFENCSKVLTKNGRMIVSLCRGQGGTPADEPRRRWDDSWQITEMAAPGNFILVGVEPFLPKNFQDYRCVGYRGQDVGFDLTGALVHIFAKAEPPYASLRESEIIARLNLVPLKPNSDILVPVLYSELYQSDPTNYYDSHVSFLKRLLVEKFREISPNGKWKYFDDDEIPVYVDGSTEVSCVVNSIKRGLRSNPFHVFPHLLGLLRNSQSKNDFTLFAGMFFKRLGVDFSGSAPAEFHIIVTGEDMSVKVERFLNYLTEVFKEKYVNLLVREKSQERDSCEGPRVCETPSNPLTEMLFENLSTGRSISAALVCDFRCTGVSHQICILNAQAICRYLFQVGWKEIWARGTKVVLIDGKPTSQQGSLYPSSYKFDITLKYEKNFSQERFYEVLWLAAGRFIERVETISEYSSPEGWSSTCYRITYRSLDAPLYRSRVVEIHSKIVGPALELGLNVAVA